MPKIKDKGGRPTVMTPDTVNKLEYAFSIGASAEEATHYAGISRNTFYEWLKRNPQYQDRIDDLRMKPVLKARVTLFNSLNDPHHAKWYLKKKRIEEFGDQLDLTSGGNPLKGTTIVFKDFSDEDADD
jgi:hypothetical protein